MQRVPFSDQTVYLRSSYHADAGSQMHFRLSHGTPALIEGMAAKNRLPPRGAAVSQLSNVRNYLARTEAHGLRKKSMTVNTGIGSAGGDLREPKFFSNHGLPPREM